MRNGTDSSPKHTGPITTTRSQITERIPAPTTIGRRSPEHIEARHLNGEARPSQRIGPDHRAGWAVVRAGTPAQRKAVIETDIVEIRIAHGAITPVFRLPAR